jgi:hypothetical protein
MALAPQHYSPGHGRSVQKKQGAPLPPAGLGTWGTKERWATSQARVQHGPSGPAPWAYAWCRPGLCLSAWAGSPA